jgi:uncharacterized membrane protein
VLRNPRDEPPHDGTRVLAPIFHPANTAPKAGRDRDSFIEEYAMDSTNSDDRGASSAVAQNIQCIADLERAARREVSRSERVSKAITDFAGSMTFVVLHIAVFATWTAWNVVGPPAMQFDPFPFGLLTGVVSLEGVFLATFVLITQNRMMAQSDRRDHLALQINLLSEQELTMALRMLRELCGRAGVQASAGDRQDEHLMEKTNVYDVMKEIDKELPKD